MKLIDIYRDKHGECSPNEEDLKLLYRILGERDETTSISHRRMPTWDEHVAFVLSRPYKGWWLIQDYRDRSGPLWSTVEEVTVGATYLSKQNEVGTFILKEHRKKGYGAASIKMIVDLAEGPVFANINPLNERSIRMVEGCGFRHVQNTYRLDKPEQQKSHQ